MGSSQSSTLLTSEVAVTGVVLVAGAYFFASNSNQPNTSTDATQPGAGKQNAKNKRKRENNKKSKSDAGASSVETLVAGDTKHPAITSSKASISKQAPSPVEKQPLPSADDVLSSSTSSKNKKRKGKAAAVASATSTPNASTTLPRPSSSTGGTTASSVVDDDGWTKVGRASDAEFGSSVASLPAEKTKSAEKEKEKPKEEEKQTLAEKLLPKPVPTQVDDMLDKPAGLARVMRVVGPDDKPPSGFSWGDFEDVDASKVDDDDGWSSVPTRSRKKTSATGSNPVSGAATPVASRPDELTKKQRQNQAKRDADKAAKADAERERLAKLAKHKRDLENERIKAQYAKGSKLSGGMKASIDENGALVWE